MDQAVGELVEALQSKGVLDDTYIIFASDNGFFRGEHRIATGKYLPYDPAARVPLLIRGPGIPHGATRTQLVWNGDLAPTILAATGARPTWAPDGMSVLPFARDAGARSGRAILLEGPPTGSVDPTPRFTGLRTPTYLYVEYRTGEVELYDVRTDPYELRNLAGSPAVAPWI